MLFVSFCGPCRCENNTNSSAERSKQKKSSGKNGRGTIASGSKSGAFAFVALNGQIWDMIPVNFDVLILGVLDGLLHSRYPENVIQVL